MENGCEIVNILPWYIYVLFTLPFFFGGIVVGVVVAGTTRASWPPLIAVAGAVGAVAGTWLGLLALPRLTNSPWTTAFCGALLASCVTSVIAAWLSNRH